MMSTSADAPTTAASLPPEHTTEDAAKNCGPIIFLTAGTAVSAKYRGAYCEATVDQVTLKFRLRVQLKGTKGIVSVDEGALISGEPIPGSEVTVRVPSTDNRPTSLERVGTVLRVADTSLYTVVFDDGDKRTLRRTQLVLKGERHFKESESLDSLPLTNPEQFRQPVIDRKKQRSSEDAANEEEEAESSSEEQDKEERKQKAHTKVSESSGCPILDLKSPSLLSEDHCPSASLGSAPELHPEAESSLLNASHIAAQSLVNEDRSSLNASVNLTVNKLESHLSASYQRLLGRLVLVNMPISHKDAISSPSSGAGNTSISSSEALARRRFTPALVVLPSAMPSIDLRLPGSGKLAKVPNLLVRSFKDNRFFPVPLCYVKRLKRPSAVELAHAHPSLRNAFERALLWLDRYELPAPWGETAMQNLLGAKDWRVAKRQYKASLSESVRSTELVNSKSRKKPSGSQVSSDSSSDEDAGTPAPIVSVGTGRNRSSVRQNTSTPKKLTELKGKTTEARKRSRPSDLGHSSRATRKLDAKRPKLKGSTRKSDSSSSSRSRSPKPSKDKRKSTAKQSSKLRKPTIGRNKSSDSDLSDNVASSDSDVNMPSGSSSEEEESSSSSSPSDSDSSSSSVDFEARDRWIAQLYRFMDEGGAPINKAPSLANKDLDLYKLYKLVRAHGGFHRVTAQLKWGYIYSKLGLPHNFAAGPRNLQAAFKRYLYPLDDISRKLGTDLDELPLARPRHLSSNSGSAMRSFIGAGRTAAGTAPKASVTDSKSLDSKATPAKLITPKSKEAVTPSAEASSVERTSEPAVECSPPVLSPPVLGRTPSPPGDHWISSTLDTTATPIRSVRKQSTPLQPAKEQSIKEPDLSVARVSRKAKEVKSTPVSTPDKAVKTTSSATADTTTSSRSSSSAESSNNGSRSERTKPTVARQPLFLQLPDDLTRFNELDKLNQIIPIGSRVRVRCGDRVAYEAKVLKHIRPQPGLVAREGNLPASWTCSTETQYRVHYMGWNTRHDEVVSRSRIISIVEWARPSDSDRPPSCSSLNLVVQEPNRRSPAATANKPNTEQKGQAKSSDLKRKEKSDDQELSEVDEEEGVESDQSQTTETASDIVTTTAPMIRRRRLMFDQDDPLHKRSRPKSKTPVTEKTLKQTLVNELDQKRAANKLSSSSKEARSSQSLKPEEDTALSKSSQRTTPRPSLPPAPSSKRPRLTPESVVKEKESTPPTTSIQKDVKPPKPKLDETKPQKTPASVKPEEKSAPEKASKSKPMDSAIVTPRKLAVKPGGESQKTKPTLTPTLHKRPSSFNRAKLSSMKDRLASKRTPLTKTPTACVRERSRSQSSSSRSSSSYANRSDRTETTPKKSAPKKIAEEKEKTPQSDASTERTTKKKAIQETADRNSSAVTKSDKPREVTPVLSQKPPIPNQRKPNKPITALVKEQTPLKRKLDTETPDKAKPVRNVQAPKPEVIKATPNEKEKVASCKKPTKSEVVEKSAAPSSKSLQRTPAKTASSSSDESASSDTERKTRETNNSSRRSSTISQRISEIPTGKKRPTGSRPSQTKPSRGHADAFESDESSDEESKKSTASNEPSDGESSESDFGAMDALPRLTRRQHRQLLGDTPPGAALQTASPVVNTTTSSGVTTTTTPPVTTSEAQSKSAVTTASPNINLKADLTEKNECSETKPISVSEVKEALTESTTAIESLPTKPSVSTAPTTQEVSTVKELSVDLKQEPKLEEEDVSSTKSDEDDRAKRLAKLRPRTKNSKAETTPQSKDMSESRGPILPKSESTDKVDDDDERSSVHTMSTDPMKDLLFDFTMSPSEESIATSSSSSEEGDVNQVKLKPSRKSVTRSQKEFSDSNDEESSQAQSDNRNEFGENSEEGGDLPKSVVGDSADVESVVRTSPQAKVRTRSERVRHTSTSSNTVDGIARKTPGKRGSGTPLRTAAFDRSPTPASESPHYSRSPIPMSGTPTGVSTTKSGVTAAAPSTARLASSRRFGGPFFPIAGFEEMSSETKCQLLQERMQRILEAWRSAKQYLKDLDQRTNRSRRLRARQTATDSQPAAATATAPQNATKQCTTEDAQKPDEQFRDGIVENAPERAAAVHFH